MRRRGDFELLRRDYGNHHLSSSSQRPWRRARRRHHRNGGGWNSERDAHTICVRSSARADWSERDRQEISGRGHAYRSRRIRRSFYVRSNLKSNDHLVYRPGLHRSGRGQCCVPLLLCEAEAQSICRVGGDGYAGDGNLADGKPGLVGPAAGEPVDARSLRNRCCFAARPDIPRSGRSSPDHLGAAVGFGNRRRGRGVALLFFRNARVFVDKEQVGKIDMLGRLETLSLRDVKGAERFSVLNRYGSVKHLVFVGPDGRKAFEVAGSAWDFDRLDALGRAAGVELGGTYYETVSPFRLDKRVPRTITWGPQLLIGLGGVAVIVPFIFLIVGPLQRGKKTGEKGAGGGVGRVGLADRREGGWVKKDGGGGRGGGLGGGVTGQAKTD